MGLELASAQALRCRLTARKPTGGLFKSDVCCATALALSPSSLARKGPNLAYLPACPSSLRRSHSSSCHFNAGVRRCQYLHSPGIGSDPRN